MTVVTGIVGGGAALEIFRDAPLVSVDPLDNPEIGPVVDRLEADHLQISGNLDEIGTTTYELSQRDTVEGRQRVVDALNRLADHLLEHLAYEEESISPTLRTMDNWFITR